ncbi:DUF898 family protein [Bradyrhizobium erythrophlei]|uniref:Uncharacterized membrane protein YjgN, DUF898 family n=1 Tax=Bradyrhizobium erythrophlei TaxID=1437360 RepID=A0A1M7U821_9BRAD|nr:DUF898 family protein [Bradyrhizobium erythrophlei]SHN79066.1 Uncharacterized membrane protein YjgN, DUF898 family [Bradyrhizobium erythrophlei]
MGSVPHVPARPPLPASAVKVEFSGKRGDFFRLVRNGTGLELITFGFYRFWLATDIRHHLWSHISIEGDAPEYTGRGRELLIGFLFAMAILLPIYLAYFLIGIEAERYKAFASFPLVLFFYLFGQFAIYRARRYRLTRTVWRGVRFWMDGSGWAYAVRAAGWALLVAVTFGAVLPWREAALERYKMRHCHYGDLQGSFEGRGSELFKRGWKLWLAALSPLIAGLAIAIVNAGHKMTSAESRVLGLVMLIWMIALPFIYGAFKAIEWRWWISGIRFGEVSFESDLASGALYGLYWKMIGWYVLISLAFGAYLVACVGLFVGFGDAAHIAARMQGKISVTVAMIFGYLAIILAMNIALRVYLLRDIWARAAGSTTVFRLEAADNVAAKGELADALGEGFANGLDVVGF